MEGYHIPVLLNEILETIQVRTGAWYVDCTVGDGGYSLEILKRGGKIIGLDVDPVAIQRARGRFLEQGINEGQFRLIQGNFSELDNLIDTSTFPVEGIIFDLGVSTMQLKTPDRGFSFLDNGPLDMRMDPKLGVTSADLINAGTRKELEELFLKYGEEKQAFKFAKEIELARQTKPITNTLELAQILSKVAFKKGKIHPATKVFQALRIVVNDELAVIATALPKALELVNPGGFIAVVSFHSLEDRIVKNCFKDFANQGFGSSITKKPIVPGEKEVSLNPASRSGKLRIFQKNVSN